MSCENKDANLLCLAGKARAGLKDAALSGVLGRRHGPAEEDRPAGVGGGCLDPRRWASAQPAQASGLHGGQRRVGRERSA